MIYLLAIALIASIPALLFCRGQHSDVTLMPGISLAVCFLLVSYIFGVAYRIPIFEFDYNSMRHYYFLLVVISFCGYGVLFGFCVPENFRGRSFSPSTVIAETVGKFKIESQKKLGVSRDLALLLAYKLPASINLFSADLFDLRARNSFPIRSISGFAIWLADSLFRPALIATAMTCRRWAQAISTCFIVALFSAFGKIQAFVALVVFVLLNLFNIGARNKVHYFIIAFSIWLAAALIFFENQRGGGVDNIPRAFFVFYSGISVLGAVLVNHMAAFSVTSIAASIDKFDVSIAPFIYAINPLPSSLISGWSEFSLIMSVRANVPCAALEMIYNNLDLFGIFLVGFLVGFFAFIIFLLKSKADIASLLLIVAFFLAPYLFGLQYNFCAYSGLLYFSALSLMAYQLFFRRLRIRTKG